MSSSLDKSGSNLRRRLQGPNGTATASANPYLQSVYAAAAASPFAAGGLSVPSTTPNYFQLNPAIGAQTLSGIPIQAAVTSASTGNPLFDAYASQYAALAASGGYAAPVGTAAALGTLDTTSQTGEHGSFLSTFCQHKCFSSQPSGYYCRALRWSNPSCCSGSCYGSGNLET